MKLKSFFSIFLFCCLPFMGHAQSGQYNKLSLEATVGMDVPLIRSGDISRTKYISVPQFQLSMRYMFEPRFGIKGHYGYNLFKNGKGTGPKITYHRLGIEGVVSVSRLFPHFFMLNLRLPKTINLLFHAGVGGSLAHYAGRSGNVKYINPLGGFTLAVKLNDRWALAGDITVVGNLRPEKLSYPEIKAYANLSVGVVYYIGGYQNHADWW